MELKPHDVKTTLHYLTRDLIYQHEKPYLVTKEVDLSNVPGAVETNRILEECPVEVHDVRTCPEKEICLNITGWTFVKGETNMSTVGFYDAPTVETAYFDELQEILKEFPQYTNVAFLDHVVGSHDTFLLPLSLNIRWFLFGINADKQEQVRKRSPKFPREVGAATEAEQPLSLTHSDFSTEGGLSRVDIYIKENPKLECVPFDMLKCAPLSWPTFLHFENHYLSCYVILVLTTLTVH